MLKIDINFVGLKQMEISSTYIFGEQNSATTFISSLKLSLLIPKISLRSVLTKTKALTKRCFYF